LSTTNGKTENVRKMTDRKKNCEKAKNKERKELTKRKEELIDNLR